MHNDTNLKTSVRLEHSVLAVEQEHELHAMVELSVPHPGDEIARPPLRVALVVDRSGSMMFAHHDSNEDGFVGADDPVIKDDGA